uniref:Uncharacterized protein n=1 Tax=uncultured Armatimonadetes bacterium TaxID=157466 RepID=A0A6J4IYC5_9BACT|nr:hypothetical protein AVDCRST_MAG63-2651 [uncultured Armatimonadetes bacterium]
MRKLFWAAALGGGLYWASKQPGGIQGVFGRAQDKIKKIQDSPDPMGTLKESFSGGPIETATPYTPLPEHPTAG